MEARRELIEALGERYRTSERVEKKRILDEFVELAGYHRKHAIRVLSRERGIKPPAPGMATRLHDDAVVTALTIIWEAADRICGKRLKAVLASVGYSTWMVGTKPWSSRWTKNRARCPPKRPRPT